MPELHKHDAAETTVQGIRSDGREPGSMIHTRGLTQTFQSRRGKEKVEVKAVDGVDIDVDAGETVGFLGPNGAGKTTTLRMLTTLLKPTSGTARVAGFDVAKDQVQVRRHIGYVSQAGSAGSNARAGEEIMDHGMLYGLSKTEAKSRAMKLFEDLDLDGLWDRQPKAMSGGQRRRLDIAMGLIHVPELVFLDEPTTGLDPQARSNLWNHIRSLRDDHGVTIFLTTHYLDEADALADRLLVIDHGTIIASDTPDNLKNAVAGDLVTVQVKDSSDVAAVASLLEKFADEPVTTQQRSETPSNASGHFVSTRIRQSASILPEIVRAMDRDSIEVEGLDVRRPTLDDVFLNLTGRSLRD